jgi:hypothetical protein
VPALIAAAGESAARPLFCRKFAHPFDWKIEGGRLLFDPLPRFIVRGAELRCRRATRETSARVGHGTFADKSADKFVSAEWLDPTKEVAVKRFHETEIINNQLFASIDIDDMRSCPVSVTHIPCGVE